MTWEDAVRVHFAKLPTSLNDLREMIENLPLGSSKNQVLDSTIDTIMKLGYNTKITKNTIKVLVPDGQRPEVMKALKDTFMPIGFEFDPLRGGSMGRLKKISKEGNAFILVKPEGSTGRASALGVEYEEQLAKTITDKFGQYGITAKTAGFTHGSDLTIQGSQGSMSVELKTSSGADFGQFRLVYSPQTRLWMPSPTKSFKKNEVLFRGLFDEFLQGYLDQMAHFPDLNDPRIKKVKGFVTGLNAHPGTGEFRKELQNAWFDGKNALIIQVDPNSISSYYEVKGDRFIQIGKRGLYAFNLEDAQTFNVPLFDTKIKTARLRFRMKPEMSHDGHHSFTVAVKMLIEPSDRDLNNEEDLEAIISELI